MRATDSTTDRANPTNHADTLSRLRAVIAQREGRTSLTDMVVDSGSGAIAEPCQRIRDSLATGWPDGDLPLRALHEFALTGTLAHGDAFAPVGVMVALLRRFAEQMADHRMELVESTRRSFPIAFIGEWCWPHAESLQPDLWRDAVWVRASRAMDRSWCAEQALAEPGIAAVVVDARDFDLTATRRLHLAARRAEMPPALVLGLRRAKELTGNSPSAAISRWMVTAEAGAAPLAPPSWTVQLVRAKVRLPATTIIA